MIFFKKKHSKSYNKVPLFLFCFCKTKDDHVLFEDFNILFSNLSSILASMNMFIEKELPRETLREVNERRSYCFKGGAQSLLCYILRWQLRL